MSGISNFKLGVLVVAYNASSTIERTISRIPPDMVSKITKILISDDSSSDNTFQVAQFIAHASELPIEVVRQEKNLGYGGNQKFGYKWAIENNLDAVVMLHADGQYAPEQMYRLVEPLIQGQAEAVFGSRMMVKGSARKGGMPLYKYFGNKLLTKVQNSLTEQNFSEWHSGYRAYAVEPLKSIDFTKMSDQFRFDTQIILEMIKLKYKISEVSISTFYGEEISHVNSIRYGIEILIDTFKFFKEKKKNTNKI